jgi:hypothetical protein
MSQSVDMNETAGMLEARLGLIDRIRRIEHALALEEQARVAAALMKGRSHDLGNLVQIAKLSALEVARRVQQADVQELVADMTGAAERASKILNEMFAAARPTERTLIGPAVAQVVRQAVDLSRVAVASDVELRIELAESVQTYATSEELEALVMAALLDAAQAVRVTLLLRERTIDNRRWVELVRLDDRHHLPDGELAHMFEPHSLLHVVAGVAKTAGGEVSLSPGRTGLELAVEIPVALARRSSQSSG